MKLAMHGKATVGGDIVMLRESHPDQYGQMWRIAPGAAVLEQKTEYGGVSEISKLTSRLKGLNPGTTYYVPAYRQNGAGVVYRKQVSSMTVVRDALLPALRAARRKLDQHREGVNVGDVPHEARAALQWALSSAQSVYDQADQYRQTSIDAALSALATEIVVFEKAVVRPGDPSALVAALAVANELLDVHEEGMNCGQVPTEARQKLQIAMGDALVIAVQAAQYTQAHLDATMRSLMLAVEQHCGK